MVDSCVLCGDDKYKVIATKLRHGKSGTVVVCDGCGLSRMLGAQNRDRLDEFYAEQYASEYHTGVKKELDSLFDSFIPVQKHRVEKLKPYLRKEDRVLEIGSSTGHFLHAVRPFVSEVQGIELNRREAQYARDVKQIPTVDVPIAKKPVPAGHYDHICLFQVLEHVPNPIRFLNDLREFLRPEGKIHIEIPNLMDPLVWFYDVEEYRDFYYQEPHLYNFTPETLRKLCEAASFKPLAVYGFQQTTLTNNLNWVFRRGPQASRWDCMQSRLPEGSIRAGVPESVKGDFEKMLSDFNSAYVRFVEKSGFTDMIFATIQS